MCHKTSNHSSIWYEVMYYPGTLTVMFVFRVRRGDAVGQIRPDYVTVAIWKQSCHSNVGCMAVQEANKRK